jgi:hypothetical protein
MHDSPKGLRLAVLACLLLATSCAIQPGDESPATDESASSHQEAVDSALSFKAGRCEVPYPYSPVAPRCVFFQHDCLGHAPWPPARTHVVHVDRLSASDTCGSNDTTPLQPAPYCAHIDDRVCCPPGFSIVSRSGAYYCQADCLSDPTQPCP